MMPVSQVDSSATISPRAVLGEGVLVGPNVVIEDDVVVGAGTRLFTGTVLHRGARVGAQCSLGPYAVVAGEPMDTAFRGEPSLAVLEDRVTLREFVTVHRATGDGMATRVGEGTLVMSYAHVSHNVMVGRRCTITTSVQLGGHCQVGDHAYLGSTALLHQLCRVGPYAILGAGSASNQDVLPFLMARGNPTRHFRLNAVGLQRNGIAGERYRALERAARALRRRDMSLFEELAAESDEVRLMRDFIAESRRGVCRFQGGG